MQAVILAAGMGERLGNLTEERPKAMMPVAGRELVLRVMDFIDHPAITSKVLVTGYLSEKLRRFIEKDFADVKIVHNPNYRAGNILSLLAALPYIDGEFILMNVDHIYPKRMLARLLETKSGISAVCDFDRPLAGDDMKVKIGKGGRLSAIDKKLSMYDCGYIGMTVCGKDSLKRYVESAKLVRGEKGDLASVESVLGWLAERYYTINICDVSGIRWLEVDTPSDLQSAEETLRSNPNFLM